MRTTVRVDDDLLRCLKQQASQEGISLAAMVNRALRRGVEALRQGARPERPFREKTFSMGEPKVDLNKALGLAAAMEDEETREELARRK